MRTLALAAALAALSLSAAAEEVPAHVGSEACAECHAEEHAAWQGSHHDLAWTLPGEGALLGDFGGAVFEHRGTTYRLIEEAGVRYIEETRDGAAPDRWPVEGVAGIAPLQQYLVATGEGRLQSHDVVWDAVRGRWYHLYPDQDEPPGNGLHWTGPYKNWNARCAECHATGYEKGYDPRARTYDSRAAEIGVGCEACHGPGAAHLDWAAGGEVPAGLGAAGFPVSFGADAQAEIQQCAGCHARREPVGDRSPVPGTPFHDAYRLSLLRPELYHADGTIRDEVYVYGSFLQSRMAARGVRCSDCHDVHAATVTLEGNAVCAQCHSPAGNPRFPTLRKASYDDPAHHFHEAGTPGAACASCHMIERVYMGIDGRRDHSFRVPRPDLAAETGAPDACTDCHEDRDADWAAAEIAQRFPASRHRGPHYGQVLAAGRLDAAAATAELMGLALGPGPGIVRATALEMLHGVADPALADQAAGLLADPDPLVRSMAIGVQRGAAPEVLVTRVVPLTRDSVATVRMAAARALLDLPVEAFDAPTRQKREAAMREWSRSLLAKADFPETHLILGGTALVMRDVRAAESAFAEAVRMDPQMVDAWVMGVRIRAALGDRAGAAARLEEALAANPTDFRLLGMELELNP